MDKNSFDLITFGEIMPFGTSYRYRFQASAE